jgi:23S rRNA (uridine2552-2'-O)-methyltransferase
LSSTRWLHRHLNDEYVQKTYKDGYRSRSAYKLIELDNKFKLLQGWKKVVDLGAYPGGWSQVVSKKVKDIVAIDIKPIDSIEGVKFIQSDVINELDVLQAKLQDQKFDLVLSDMAPNASGLQSLDHTRIMLLCEAALSFAEHFLNRDGSFVVKIFQGESDKDFYYRLKKSFNIVRYFKPKSSRPESAEMYLVSMGFIKN